MTKAEKKKIEKEKWNELCEYVKRGILEYDDNMKFPTYLAMRLQGIKRGEFISNNAHTKKAEYDDFTILCAFKLCKKRIVKYLHDNEKNIKDERHKINLIMKIVEPEINDVYLRLKQSEKVQERVSEKSFDNQSNESASYQKKTKEVSEKMKKLF